MPVCVGVGLQQEQVKGSVKPTGMESHMGLGCGFVLQARVQTTHGYVKQAYLLYTY